jgi:hypothetical protein
MRFFASMALGLAFVGAAGAEPLIGKDAKAALYAPLKAEVEILAAAGLPADQAAALQAVGGAQPYYGAIAISPENGLMSETTVAAANYHDTDAASVAALEGCNALKKGKPDCVVAALIRPKGWKETGLSLSSDATAAFKDYDMKAGALAVSVTTGAWGMAAGDGASDLAIADCVAKNAKATDCSMAIAD